MSRAMMDGLLLDFVYQKEQTNVLFWRNSFVHPTIHNSTASSKFIWQIRMLAVCTCAIVAPINMNYYSIGYLEEATPIPQRYHFSANERIAPIWVVPTLGYALTSKQLGEEGMSIGVSHLPLHPSVR